ncbi:MAG: hypothetical protein HC805_04535, partial [Alkalinema sp. RL_2_19]|nr:hypothetical protein [Alkalinema sp. RL_2_19]
GGFPNKVGADGGKIETNMVAVSQEIDALNITVSTRRYHGGNGPARDVEDVALQVYSRESFCIDE